MVFIISLVLIWTFSGILLLINPQNKSNRRASFIAILIVPATLFGGLYNLFHPVFDTGPLWGYILTGIMVFLLIYGCFLIRHGFFGRKVMRFARNSLDNDGPTVNGGDVLRHALKNELAKISLCSRNIEASGPRFDPGTFHQSIGENAKNIQASADYLLMLIKRINDFTKEITFIESAANPLDIIEDAVNRVHIFLQAKKVTLIRNYSPEQTFFFYYVMPYI